MPQISRFFGIIISMFYDDHNPPHFHAQYNEYQASIDIEELKIIKGKLPARPLGLVVEWASQYQEELKKNWELMKSEQPLEKIKPLE